MNDTTYIFIDGYRVEINSKAILRLIEGADLEVTIPGSIGKVIVTPESSYYGMLLERVKK